MPPRLVVKKRPVLVEQASEDSKLVKSNSSDSEEVCKPKVKRIVKRIVKKEVSASPESEAKAEVIEDPMNIYLSSLNSSDEIVMKIAKDHLGTSFCIEKSVGFVDFLASRK